MARPLTGYALTNHFRRLRLREVFSPLEAYLFLELVAICNDEGWPAEFSASNGVLQAALNCSEQGLINARLRLERAGLVAFVSGNRRTPTRYQFPVQDSSELSQSAAKGSTQFSQSPADGSTQHPTELSHSAANGSTQDSTQLSHSVKNRADGSTQGSSEDSTEFSPYKEQTKTKRKEGEESAASAAALAASFSENESAVPAASSSPTTPPPPRPKSSKKAGATAEQLAALPLPHPGSEFAQLWATFRESPKQVGKALSAFELMLKKLGKYPEGFAIVMLERAIQGGWSGVENPGTAQGFVEWQAMQRRQPAPAVAPLPIPDLELNQDFVAQLAAQEAASKAQHLARYAAAA
jgi:hypothetical protein